MNLPFGYHLSADFHGGFAVFLGLLLLLYILIYFMNRQRVVTQGSLSRTSYGFILLSRALISLAILLMIFDPEVNLERRQMLQKRVVLLIDQSMSMQQAWEGSEADLTASIEEIITKLEAAYPLDIASLRGASIDADELAFTESSSTFDWQAQQGAAAQEPFQAVFVISDGHLNQGRSPLDLPWSRSVPIYPILPLPPGSFKSLTFEELHHEPVTRGAEQTPIIARIRQNGLIGQTVTMTIANAQGETIASGSWRMDQVISELRLPVALQQDRSHSLQVALSLSDGSLRSERSLLIDHGDKRKKVLLASEALDLTHKFLLQHLPDSLFLTSVLLGADPDPDQRRFELSEADLVIEGHFHQCKTIGKYVSLPSLACQGMVGVIEEGEMHFKTL